MSEPAGERPTEVGPAAAGPAPADPVQAEVELTRCFRDGSAEAFAGLMRRYEGPLYRFLLLRCRCAADAETLAAEAFVRAWQQRGRYSDRWRFSTWLFTIARRQAVSRARAERRRPSEPLPADLVGPAADPAEASSRAEERVNLWNLARRVLSEDQRSALWLRYVEGLDTRSLGAVLERSPAAVRVLLFRARRALGAQLEAPDAARDPLHAPSHPQPAPARSIAKGA